MSYDTEWTDDSLRLLRERLAAPLPPRPKPRRPHRRTSPPPPVPRWTAQHRAALMASVKPRVIPSAVAVRSRDYVRVRQLMGTLSRDEMAALAVTALAAADQSRLLLVVQSPDDGLPDGAERQAGAA
jgi:hypothetical protein